MIRIGTPNENGGVEYDAMNGDQQSTIDSLLTRKQYLAQVSFLCLSSFERFRVTDLLSSSSQSQEAAKKEEIVAAMIQKLRDLQSDVSVLLIKPDSLSSA